MSGSTQQFDSGQLYATKLLAGGNLALPSPTFLHSQLCGRDLLLLAACGLSLGIFGLLLLLFLIDYNDPAHQPRFDPSA